MLGSSTGLAAGYVLALLAAVVNAGAQVLQRKASIKEPSELQMSPRLLIDLARRPVWLAGISGVVLGTLFQIASVPNASPANCR